MKWLSGNLVKPRIPDEYYEKLVKMYRSRATRWRIVAGINLICMGLIIGAGVLLFWKGDPAETHRAESETALTIELSTLNRQLADIGKSGAELVAHTASMERVQVLAYILSRVKPAVESVLMDPPDSDALENAKTTVRVAQKILQAIEMATRDVDSTAGNQHRVFVIDVRDHYANDTNVFPRKTLLTMKDMIESTGESCDGELEVVKEISAALSANTETGKESLRKNVESKELIILDTVLANAEGQKNATAQKSIEWQIESQAREENREALRKQIEVVEKQLKDVRDEREKILFMSWIPGLTVRVGAVVLLLFLTQILMSSYRYTTALATYYLARADAVLLLQPKANNGTWYDLEQLKTLIEYLTPSSLVVDSVTTPSEQLVELAKAWATKK